MVDLLEIVRRVTGFIDEFEFLFGVICFVLGVIFALLWGTADLLGRRIERERAEAYAAYEAEAEEG